jgi:hypothetical protein
VSSLVDCGNAFVNLSLSKKAHCNRNGRKAHGTILGGKAEEPDTQLGGRLNATFVIHMMASNSTGRNRSPTPLAYAA